MRRAGDGFILSSMGETNLRNEPDIISYKFSTLKGASFKNLLDALTSYVESISRESEKVSGEITVKLYTEKRKENQ